MRINKVVFGPWTGEFGWELAYWQGYVRKMCYNEYNNAYKVAISYDGHQILYDSIDRFVSLPTSIANKVLSQKAIQCMGGLVGDDCSTEINALITEYKRNGYKIVTYDSKLMPSNLDYKNYLQEFIPLRTNNQYGSVSDKRSVALFPRCRQHESFRNWPKEYWIQLAKTLDLLGYNIVMV